MPEEAPYEIASWSTTGSLIRARVLKMSESSSSKRKVSS